ncbi:MAG: cytidylate kinase-like family protein [Dehalococcoidales bacterium]|nr:cytidylate kinase-like family protein [Dehalococcoidales bacterium]
MPVITIRGYLGSGAPEIGKLVADNLNLDYVDRDIIAEVAKRLRWSKDGVEKKEMPPGTFLSKIVDALGHSYVPPAAYPTAYLPVWEIPLDDSSYLIGLNSVIKELAASQSIVIRGRGSQFILKDYPGVLHVLVAAPFELRLKRVIESMNLNEESAKKEIERFDSSHREFLKRYFKADSENPLYYDLTINSANFSYENAAAIIMQAIPFKK